MEMAADRIVEGLMAPDPEESSVFRPSLAATNSGSRSTDHDDRHAFLSYVSQWEQQHGHDALQRERNERHGILRRAAPALQQAYDALENKYAYFDPTQHAQRLLHVADLRLEGELLDAKAAIHAPIVGEDFGFNESLDDRRTWNNGGSSRLSVRSAAPLQPAAQRPSSCSQLVQRALARQEEYERTIKASPGRSSVAFTISPSPKRLSR
jgi:hypothetical protein